VRETGRTVVAHLLGESPIPLYFGGKWRPNASGEVVEVLNPADGELLASVSAGSASDVGEAVDAAWAALAVGRRSR
jgi:acyl-CoA reductase-like NAD-dependent aldehyde dehydrogenase